MSVLPVQSHSNNGAPLWKTSALIPVVQEAVEIELFTPTTQTAVITPTTQNFSFGYFEFAEPLYIARLMGSIRIAPYLATPSSFTMNIYLTPDANFVPSNDSQKFTGIVVNVGVTNSHIVLDQMSYTSAIPFSKLYLACEITSAPTTGGNLGAVATTATYSQANTFNYSGWTFVDAVSVDLNKTSLACAGSLA